MSCAATRAVKAATRASFWKSIVAVFCSLMVGRRGCVVVRMDQLMSNAFLIQHFKVMDDASQYTQLQALDQRKSPCYRQVQEAQISQAILLWNCLGLVGHIGACLDLKGDDVCQVAEASDIYFCYHCQPGICIWETNPCVFQAMRLVSRRSERVMSLDTVTLPTMLLGYLLADEPSR